MNKFTKTILLHWLNLGNFDGEDGISTSTTN